MYKYFDINDKWGKGFITYKDREHLHFIVIGEIVKVISDKKGKMDEWAKKNGVINITEEKALADIKQWQLNGLTSKKVEIEKELIDVQHKIDVLKVV